MTYFFEIRKQSKENEKRNFGRATLLKKNGTWRIEKLKDEKDADEMVIKRATRKLWELDNFL